MQINGKWKDKIINKFFVHQEVSDHANHFFLKPVKAFAITTAATVLNTLQALGVVGHASKDLSGVTLVQISQRFGVLDPVTTDVFVLEAKTVALEHRCNDFWFNILHHTSDKKV